MSPTSYLIRAEWEEKNENNKLIFWLVYQWSSCQNSMMRSQVLGMLVCRMVVCLNVEFTLFLTSFLIIRCCSPYRTAIERIGREG